MPTILRIGPYRIYFWSHEPNEPPHVHVDRDRDTVKFWLGPVQLAHNFGFNPRELHKIEQIIVEYEEAFLERWHENFPP